METLLIVLVGMVVLLLVLMLAVAARVVKNLPRRREAELEAEIAQLESKLVVAGYRFEEDRVVGSKQPDEGDEGDEDDGHGDYGVQYAGSESAEVLAARRDRNEAEARQTLASVSPLSPTQAGAFGTPSMPQPAVAPPPRPPPRYGFEAPVVPTDKAVCLNCTHCSWEAGQDALRSHGPFAAAAALLTPAKMFNKVLKDEEGKPLPDAEQPPESVPVDATWDKFIGCMKHSQARYGYHVCEDWTPQAHVKHLRRLQVVP